MGAAPAAVRPLRGSIGHVHASPDPVSRVLPLELRSAGVRRWALALEALRLARGGAVITESPDDLEVGGIRVPASWSNERVLPIRYPARLAGGKSQIPEISFAALHQDPSLARQLAGKVVFIGVTAQSAARDRLATPYGLEMMSGVEIHANAYETMARQDFLTYASRTSLVGFCLLLTVLAGLVFALWTGWQAYTAGALLMIAAHVAPHVAFTQGVIFPYLGPCWRAGIGGRGGRLAALRGPPAAAEIGIGPRPLPAGDPFRDA
jgi:Predicted transmembrane sensor domain